MLDKRDAEDVSASEGEAARAAAELLAKGLWGPNAGALESADLKERIEGRGCQVGIFKVVHLAKFGKGDSVFLALGRGRSWQAAFEDAARFKAEIERKLGNEGVAAAEVAYRLPLTKKRA